MLWQSGDGQGSQVGRIRWFVPIDNPRCPVSPFVSLRAGSSHSSTVTVSLFCRNYCRCSCSHVQHPGVSLTFRDAFQRCSQLPLTFSKSYGECLDNFLTSSEMIECGSPESLYTRRGLRILVTSPGSGRGLVRSASGIFTHCGPFWRSQGCQLTVAEVDFRVSFHGKPKTRLYTFIGMTKTSDSSTGLRCSKY